MPHLSIRALGPLVVTLDDQPIMNLAYDKVWALLIYLAHAADHPHRREQLATLLWPDQLEHKALTNLRQALARLRKAIGDRTEANGDPNGNPDVKPPFLLIERADIQFNAAGDSAFDVSEFCALLAACATHPHRHAESCAACAERREQAISLYRGAFLDNFYVGDSDLFEEWATLVRERLHQHALDALAALVIYHERHGNYAQALRHSERQLELDPWREEAYRQIMRLLALNGQRGAALHRYERCRAILEAELGVAPAAETTALYEQIRAADVGAANADVADVDAPSVSGAVKIDYLALPTKRGHNLPLQPTPFIGRQQELAALSALLADAQCRLITLLGPGGVGKTRLALQVAGEESESFADGATFVTLAPVNSAEFIVPTVAATLNLTLPSQAAPQTELLRYLRDKDLLLVLDNFEHLLLPVTPSPRTNGPLAAENGSATEFLSAILQQSPGVKLLVTSRERLNVQGEWVFDVGGLETPVQLPQMGTEQVARKIAEQTAEFNAYSAVALFLQTARRVQKEFNPTAADRAALVRICQLVQGMPLALELAAAWVRVLSCREIAQEIGHSLSFLTTTLRDLPERHRSLQAVFDHSWKLLAAEEQRVFACCSVFRGGFTREAAVEVAGASLSLLAALVDKSLLRRNLDGRYEVHELARQYGAARLADAQEEAQTRNRHLKFFMHFAETAEPQIRGGQQIAQWHEWVEIEHDNLRAALEWSLNGGEFEPGLRIVAALWEFWMNRGHALEGQNQAERFLARPEAAARTALRGKAAHTAGVCAFYYGRLQAALAWHAESAAIGRELGTSGHDVLALGLIGEAYTRINLQEFDTAQALSQETLALGEELQDEWLKGDALNQLGIVAWQRGDLANARRYLLESLECFLADGYSVMRAPVQMRLGAVLYAQGDHAAAQAYLWKSVAVCEEVGDKLRGGSALTQLGYVTMAQGNNLEAETILAKALLLIGETGHVFNRINPLNALGRLAQRQGDYARAHTLHAESLNLAEEMQSQARLAHTLESFACLTARQGGVETAARLFGATDMHVRASGKQLGASQVPFDPIWRQEHEQLVAVARTALGEEAFAAAWAAGAAMTLDEAAALVEAQRQRVT